MIDNEKLDRKLYTYPDTPDVLRNKFDIRDADKLEEKERLLVAQRSREGVPKGDFDLAHVQAIHGHLFQDVYEWSGQLRQVETRKLYWYEDPAKIADSVAKTHSQLAEKQFLRGLNRNDFAEQAATVIRDLNFAHPFREGNGRTLIQYLNQLAPQAGHAIDITRTAPQEWSRARMESPSNHTRLTRCIEQAVSEQNRTRGQGNTERTAARERVLQDLAKAKDKNRDRGPGRGR